MLNIEKKILRLPQVKIQTGCSRSTIYMRITEGLFPKPIKLGMRSVGWPASEIDILNSARIAGKNDEEIRSLVSKLEAARKSSMQEA